MSLSTRTQLQGDLLTYVQSKVNLIRKEYKSYRGKELKGPCPVCGGEDRFWIHPNYLDGRWYCRQCEPKGGDLIALIMKVEGVNYKEARHRAGFMHSSKPKRKATASSKDKRYMKEWQQDHWQEWVGKYIERAHAYLFSDKGVKMREYLNKRRGIDDSILRAAEIGYSPVSFEGGGIKFPQGIVIPYQTAEEIYTGVKVKVPPPGKYMHIKGGKADLYRACNVPHAPELATVWSGNDILLLESELDALLVESVIFRYLQREKIDRLTAVRFACVNPIALGGTQEPGVKWRSLCQETHRQFIALDKDEAGHKLAEKYDGIRLVPTEKDPGEMWEKGGDQAILDWFLPVLNDIKEEE